LLPPWGLFSVWMVQTASEEQGGLDLGKNDGWGGKRAPTYEGHLNKFHSSSVGKGSFIAVLKS
jgi:hypothetical protein